MTGRGAWLRRRGLGGLSWLHSFSWVGVAWVVALLAHTEQGDQMVGPGQTSKRTWRLAWVQREIPSAYWTLRRGCGIGSAAARDSTRGSVVRLSASYRSAKL